MVFEVFAAITIEPAWFALALNPMTALGAPTAALSRLPGIVVWSPEANIKVYNILGQTVRTLADHGYEAGTHQVTWDGTNRHGEAVASGLYLYRIVAGDFTQSKKMVLLK